MRKNTSISFVTEIDANIESQVRARLEGSMGLLALRDNLLFPGTVTPITVGRAKSLKALRKAEKTKPTKKADRNEKPGIFRRAINFLKDVKTELKKVTWLTPDELMKSTGVVAGIVAFFTLYTWIVDSGFGALAAMILGNK